MSYLNTSHQLRGRHHAIKGLIVLVITYQTFAPFSQIPSNVVKEPIGYVLDLKGSWVLNNDSIPLSPGAVLPARGIVGILHGYEFRQSDLIVIVDHQGRVIIRKYCAKPGECDKPILLPAATQSNESKISQLIKATMSVLGREPQKFTSLISRGRSLDEGVAGLKAGEVNLSSILTKMPDGLYHLRFDSLMDDKKTILGPVILHWHKNKSVSVKVSGIKPGLYEVKLLDNQHKQPLEQGTEAWVLILGSPQYQNAVTEYQEAQPLISQWRDRLGDGDSNVREGAVRNFLKAYLAYLAVPTNR